MHVVPTCRIAAASLQFRHKQKHLHTECLVSLVLARSIKLPLPPCWKAIDNSPFTLFNSFLLVRISRFWFTLFPNTVFGRS
ncbi:hypothetical protein T440DRAFT_279664 [Plenodomus tracheiphilus IPT5]|uniref:Uncharacterized protein n=1 Tax=Plenodomus tracheiphilus IPT5 TaxID=1408161 RepID=A0A6A7ASC8_9PLEO|nr:hypothetical protein T440DRAFT_284646 [Plenodomus tracheiphilus IPT5]KAF2845267.1 hypothetical protein T440DRAFT_279664 [Plenodomus tracheiphilus IPT5]